MQKKNAISMAALAVIAAGLLSFSVVPAAQQAFAFTTNDGIVIPETTGTTNSYGTEYNTLDQKNFPSGTGTIGLHFKGKNTDALVLGGYLKVGDCTNGGDQISFQVNGGPHNSNNPTWADTMDYEVSDYAGFHSKYREEATHPTFSGVLASNTFNLGGDLCSLNESGFVGVMIKKMNVDLGQFGGPQVWLQTYVDTGGLDANGDPVNNWVMTGATSVDPNTTNLKSIFEPYVQTIGHQSDTYQSIRLDNLYGPTWNVQSNQPYQHMFLVNITNTDVDCEEIGC